MAMTMEQLKQLCDEMGLRYFLDPRRTAVTFGLRGDSSTYHLLALLDLDGTFLQLRSIEYVKCLGGHPSLLAVLKVLGELNLATRLVKYGWDGVDGEIVAFGDMWIMDGTVTPNQFRRMLVNWMGSVDSAYLRLTKTIETGKDPGPDTGQAGSGGGGGKAVTEV